MNLSKRIASLETKHGVAKGRRTLFLTGRRDDPAARAIAERCAAEGIGIKVIRFGVVHSAETPEEAIELVEAHKRSESLAPLTVCKRSEFPSTVLASYDPGYPEWLVKAFPGKFSEKDS